MNIRCNSIALYFPNANGLNTYVYTSVESWCFFFFPFSSQVNYAGVTTNNYALDEVEEV